MSQCGIYKYVWHGEVIYIGKSNSDIEKRIQCHSREDKFQKYLGDVDVYFCFLPNEATTDIYELYYINKYHPVLNVSSKYDDAPVGIEVADVEWNKYSPSKYWCKKNNKKPSDVIRYNNSKITKLKELMVNCKNISESIQKFKSIIDNAKDSACSFNEFLRQNDDYNQFETYVNYRNKLFEMFMFIDDCKYDEYKWEKYSNSFSSMIEDANKVIKELNE